MSLGSTDNTTYAHWLSVSAGALLSLFGFLSMFGVNMVLGNGNFFAYIIMIILGLFVLAVEIDNDYMPMQIKLLMKSKKMRAYMFFVIAILNFSAIIPAVLLLIAAILYFI